MEGDAAPKFSYKNIKKGGSRSKSAKGSRKEPSPELNYGDPR